MSSSSPELLPFVDSIVAVVTNDGRVIVGYLRGFDQLTNLVLTECHERVFSVESGVEQVALGTYLVRGANVYGNRIRLKRLLKAIVGEIDEDLDNRFDFTQMRAQPLKPVSYA